MLVRRPAGSRGSLRECPELPGKHHEAKEKAPPRTLPENRAKKQRGSSCSHQAAEEIDSEGRGAAGQPCGHFGQQREQGVAGRVGDLGTEGHGVGKGGEAGNGSRAAPSSSAPRATLGAHPNPQYLSQIPLPTPNPRAHPKPRYPSQTPAPIPNPSTHPKPWYPPQPHQGFFLSGSGCTPRP